jgi:NTE family protein
MSRSDDPTVAIACQGGGSHTAFTAGVLDRLLEETDLGFDVVGLSGTSGGAICAFTAWYGLATEGREEARRLLAQVWDDIGVEDAVGTAANAAGVWLVRAQGSGMPMPTFSPYDTPASDWGREALRAALEGVADPEELAALRDRAEDLPRLDIGAVDVQRGTFRTFDEGTVSHDAVLASAAVPNLFQAAPVTGPDGTTRYYWDGLFSQNPPLGSLFRPTAGRAERADKLWIVQINPQREDDIPTDLEAIADRRNELGGNLSVNQELSFIRLLNEWATTGVLGGQFDPIEVRTINLDESILSPDRPLDYATKVDRSQAFLDRLWEHGRDQAERFLATELNRRRVTDRLRAIWSGELDERRAAAVTAESYEIHLPTGLAEFRSYLGGEPTRTPEPTDREGALALARAIRRAVPDLELGVEEQLAEDDRVATRWEASGTHTGRLLDIEPTGNEVTLSGMRIDRFEASRMVETWLLLEQWSLLRQVDAAAVTTPVATATRVAPTPVVTELAAPAENEATARALVADVWNDGRREPLDHLLDERFALHFDNRSTRRGRETYWEFVQTYRNAFPDLELTVEDAVSEGDHVVLRLTLRGTHEGRFLDLEPTGRGIEVQRMVIHHLDDGRIIETGVVEDTLGELRQLRA